MLKDEHEPVDKPIDSKGKVDVLSGGPIREKLDVPDRPFPEMLVERDHKSDKNNKSEGVSLGPEKYH